MACHPFEEKLQRAWPPEQWRDLTVVVAVSGGPDSIALLRAMAASAGGAGRLIAAHFNHQWRGQEAEEDEAFVVRLCQQLDMPCRTGRPEPDAARPRGGQGLEALARRQRYAFLTRVGEQQGARYIATGHTADDQAETILHRIIRGTGLAGLAGIPPARQLTPTLTLVRPLLGFRRSETVGYLQAIGQPFRTDATNEQLQFTRNRIRHQLLPLLQSQYNSGVLDALLRLGRLAGEAQQVVDAAVEPIYEQSVARCSGQVSIDCNVLRTVSLFLIRELLIKVWQQEGWPLQSMGYAQWEQLAQMVRADAAQLAVRQQSFPGAILARRDGQCLLLRRSGGAAQV